VDIDRAWESIRENIKASLKESSGYYELKQHKPLSDGRVLKLLNQGKWAKLQWLQNPGQIN
jgi:hypothetical protein